MSMTKESKLLHEQYEAAHEIVKKAVDNAYSAARKSLEDFGMHVSNSDPAEELVAAIYKYVIDSAQ